MGWGGEGEILICEESRDGAFVFFVLRNSELFRFCFLEYDDVCGVFVAAVVVFNCTTYCLWVCIVLQLLGLVNAVFVLMNEFDADECVVHASNYLCILPMFENRNDVGSGDTRYSCLSIP